MISVCALNLGNDMYLISRFGSLKSSPHQFSVISFADHQSYIMANCTSFYLIFVVIYSERETHFNVVVTELYCRIYVYGLTTTMNKYQN